MIFKIRNEQKPNPLDFKDFKNLICAETQIYACADAKIFGFQRLYGFGMCKDLNLWNLIFFKIWHVQKPKSFDFNYFKDLECATAQIFRF